MLGVNLSKKMIFLALLLLPLSHSFANTKCKLIYFYEPDCRKCEIVSNEILPELIETYGKERIDLIKRNVNEIKNFEAMVAFENHYQLSAESVPEIYTASGAIHFTDTIKDDLFGLVKTMLESNTPGRYEEYLEAYLQNKNNTVLHKENVLPLPYQQKKMKMYVFQKPTCHACNRLALELSYIIKKFPETFEIIEMDIGEREAKVFNEALCRKYGVKESLRMTAPAVFISDQAFIGESSFNKNSFMLEIVNILQNQTPTPNISAKDIEDARQSIIGRFNNIAWTGVLLAGLLDGVNPCAFVTIIFLLSYLALMKYTRKEIAIVGISFTASVFITYLLLGLGFLKFVDSIKDIPYIIESVYVAAIAISALIGIMNIRDAYRIRKGSLKDMEMKLSDNLRSKINEIIRKNVRLHHCIIGAVIIGFAVSILELACTGQVYLPTILFILSTQGFQLHSIALLVAYNLAFIVPLVIVFIMFWRGGTDGNYFASWLGRYSWRIKLTTGLLFIGLALFLGLFYFP